MVATTGHRNYPKSATSAPSDNDESGKRIPMAV